jgi:hypothetical protein
MEKFVSGINIPYPQHCRSQSLPWWLGGGGLKTTADPGCLSRIPIFTQPGFWIPDRIPKQQQRGEKIFFVIPFYVDTNFTKLKIILVLKC